MDASDFDVILNYYARTSGGKTFKKAHEVNLKHLEEDVKGIINKNSGENSIKKFRNLKVSEHIGISKQADEFRRIIGEFVPENFELEA